MTTYRITIEPVSPGTQDEQSKLVPGSGQYAVTPEGEREIVIPASAAQIVGIQGYLTLIKAGTDTSTIETAITAVGPT